jgi:alkylation response protein AidB-like acyl-CoA dehydrogenase
MARLATTEGLTEFQQEILDTVRGFVDKEILPYATDLEHKDEFPDAIVDGMKEMGLFGLMIPEEYGGLGESLLTYALVVEQVARGWMSVSGVINTHFIVAYMLMHHGTQEQQDRLLPLMATGELRGGFSMSEPECGSTSRRSEPRRARRRRLRPRRPEDVAHQRRAGRASSPRWSRPTRAPTRSTGT